MRRFILGITGLALALAACGSTLSANPGTTSSGPIVISTDHARYVPAGSLQITVHNTLANPIYAYDTQSGCSILALQQQVNGAWQTSSLAKCPLGRPAQLVTIAAGGTYSTTISAGYPGLKQLSFPLGAYRLALGYLTAPPANPAAVTPTMTYSATIQVQS